MKHRTAVAMILEARRQGEAAAQPEAGKSERAGGTLWKRNALGYKYPH